MDLVLLACIRYKVDLVPGLRKQQSGLRTLGLRKEQSGLSSLGLRKEQKGLSAHGKRK